MEKRVSYWDVVRAVALAVFFLGMVVLGYVLFGHDNTELAVRAASMQWNFPFGLTLEQVYPALLAVLLAGLLTATLSSVLNRREQERPVWYYPLCAALLTLCGLGIAYLFLGIWPLGQESCMLVDMHHQYAPLLAKLRTMFLDGGSFLYSFDLGMGASVLPAFAYYLASPLNLLLVLFPEHLLTEGIFFITILKNMLIAAAAALCLQYVYRRRSPAVLAVSLMYAMSMYVLAYSWNVMWLDGLIALPLVVMGFEHLMRTGKYLPYVLSLAYALYANYYVAFMLCLFLVLYFFAFLFRQKREASQNRRVLWRFTLGSLLGGGLVMFLVLPTFLALGQTSAAGAALPEMNTYFDLFDVLGRQLYQVTPTIRSGNLPNLYCGVAVLVLVPLFALNPGISRRRRVTYMALLGAMVASLVLNQVNLLWHGLHSPNDLPYRFSFICSFVLLLISYETLLHIKTVPVRHIFGVLAGVIGYLVLEERFGNNEAYDFTSIYVSLLLAVLYAALCYLVSQEKVRRQVGGMLLLALVTMELTLNASGVLTQLDRQEYYTNHGNYVDNEATESVRMAVEAMEMRTAKEGFRRVEFLPRRTCMDTALFQYPGITSFASSNSYRTTRMMGALGYAVNGVNSYLYKSFIPMTDSLLGIRYVALQTQLTDHRQLQLVDTVVNPAEDGTAETYYIYKNTTALPLAWRADSAVKEWASSYYDPTISINSLYTAMTGVETPVLAAMPIETYADTTASATVGGTHGFHFSPNGVERVDFRAYADTDGQYFIYVDCRGADSLYVTQGDNSWSVTTHEPYFIDAGYLTAGDYTTVTVSSDSACSGNIYFLRLDDTAFYQAIDTLSADGLQVTSFTDDRIVGTVDASAAGAMVTTIPYDAGWQVTVDGKRVDTYPLDRAVPDGAEEDPNAGALLGFDIPAGAHEVEMVFVTHGLIPGGLLSVISLLLLVAVVLFTGRFYRWAERYAVLRWLLDTADVDALPDEDIPPVACAPSPEEALPSDVLPDTPPAEEALSFPEEPVEEEDAE